MAWTKKAHPQLVTKFEATFHKGIGSHEQHDQCDMEA